MNNGYYLAKGLVVGYVRQAREDIYRIFQTYTGQKKDFDTLARQLYQEDTEGFVACCKAAQNVLPLHRLFSSGDIEFSLRFLGHELSNFNTQPLLHFSSRHVAKEAYHWKVPAHQDWPSNQGSINGITAWVPLVDVTPELGPLEVIPNSHLLGAQPHKLEGVPVLEKEYEGWVSLPMKAGDVLFFNTLLIHRSGENVTDQIRLSAAGRYNDLAEPTYIERKYPRTPPLDKRKCDDWPTAEDVKAHVSSAPQQQRK